MPNPSIGVDGWRCAVTDQPDSCRVVELYCRNGPNHVIKAIYWLATKLYCPKKVWRWQIQDGFYDLYDQTEAIAWRELNAPT